MNNPNMLPIDEFAKSIGLNEEQTRSVKLYIIALLVDNLKQMKDEYNQEIDQAMKQFSNS